MKQNKKQAKVKKKLGGGVNLFLRSIVRAERYKFFDASLSLILSCTFNFFISSRVSESEHFVNEKFVNIVEKKNLRWSGTCMYVIVSYVTNYA